MVRLVNLGEDGDLEAAPHPHLAEANASASAMIGNEIERPNPNLNQFSAAMGCYPIISLLTTYLDLTALSELARTCRQVRANLLQYRELLISRALRCENEDADPAQRLGSALHASHDVWNTYGQNGVKVGRITSGKVGACARDMVGACRGCGKVICRNCCIKQPPSKLLELRHRRLCRTCMKSPLENLTTLTRTVDLHTGLPTSTRRVCPKKCTGVILTFCCSSYYSNNSSSSSSEDTIQEAERTFTRSPCTCHTDMVWLCQPCGQTTRTDDTTYMRGWKWRTRYSHCGGIGAGLGEGNEGVECGRSSLCLASRMVEKDVECDFEEIMALQRETAKAGMQGRQWNGSSYSTQEIVGIGGKVKTKVKKRVPVGAIVKEYEDERESEEFLKREQCGQNRSWCSWCQRVIVGKKDVGEAGKSTESFESGKSAQAT